jgi:hypothetical protein
MKRLLLTLPGLLLLAGCGMIKAPGIKEVSAQQQLRIENAGSQEVRGLTVLFPGPTADSPARRIEFGDIAAGQTSAYRDVPGGVYRYAAYEYTLDGRLVQQSVIDWIGESPMQGTKFTYRLALDPTKEQGEQIQLIEVRVDEQEHE